MSTFLICGLWHGAAWTFVAWGAYWGLLLILYALLKPLLRKIPEPKNALSQKLWFILRVIFFFQLTCAGWLVFKAESLSQIRAMAQGLVLNFIPIPCGDMCAKVFFYSFPLLMIQFFQYSKNDLMIVLKFNIWTRAIIYFTLFYLLLIFAVSGGKEFIYAKF